MEHLHFTRLHQITGNRRSRRIQHEVLECRYALPVAVVLEEPPAFATANVFDGKGAGIGQVLLETFTQALDPVAKHAA
ncbi:hypothetical protein D3C72_2076370 [compost metagenome]